MLTWKYVQIKLDRYLKCGYVSVVEAVLDISEDTRGFTHTTFAQEHDLEVIAAFCVVTGHFEHQRKSSFTSVHANGNEGVSMVFNAKNKLVKCRVGARQARVILDDVITK